MAAPKVKIRKVDNRKFLLTYWQAGKRIHRKTLNCSKAEAELISAKQQSEMLAGEFDLNPKRSISLESLIKEFLRIKKPHLAPKSYSRYPNYLETFCDYLIKYFPAACVDI